MDRDQESTSKEKQGVAPRLYEFPKLGEKSALEQVRSLKHELRTPVNHIIGYGALLLEAAEDAGNDALIDQANQIQAVGSELNKRIERALLSTDQALPPSDIEQIEGAVEGLIRRIEADLESDSFSFGNGIYLDDLNKVLGASRRLFSLLEKMRTQLQSTSENIRHSGTA